MENAAILLVQDNPDQEALASRTLKKNNIGHMIIVARDGAEARDFLFCTGACAGRDPHETPELILPDIKLPKVDGLEVLLPHPRQRKHGPACGCDPHIIQSRKGFDGRLPIWGQFLHAQASGLYAIRGICTATWSILAGPERDTCPA